MRTDKELKTTLYSELCEEWEEIVNQLRNRYGLMQARGGFWLACKHCDGHKCTVLKTVPSEERCANCTFFEDKFKLEEVK